jgi:hypothetical protein
MFTVGDQVHAPLTAAIFFFHAIPNPLEKELQLTNQTHPWPSSPRFHCLTSLNLKRFLTLDVSRTSLRLPEISIAAPFFFVNSIRNQSSNNRCPTLKYANMRRAGCYRFFLP